MSEWHEGPCVTQRVRSLDLTTHASLSAIWRGFAPGFVNYKKGCTRLPATSNEVVQLLIHGRWFSLGTPASSTTKTGGHGIAEILLKVALKHQKSKNLIRTTWMSPPSILRKFANVSPFFNSPSHRLRITLLFKIFILKFTIFIQGNNIASTNLDMIRNLQHLHMNKKCYAYKTWSVTHHCNSKYRKSSQYREA